MNNYQLNKSSKIIELIINFILFAIIYYLFALFFPTIMPFQWERVFRFWFWYSLTDIAITYYIHSKRAKRR